LIQSGVAVQQSRDSAAALQIVVRSVSGFRIRSFANRNGIMPYSEIFNDHIANPRNAGELPGANGVAEETNPVCGDRLRLSLLIKNGRIEMARFLAYGCAPTLACGSMLAMMIEGMPVKQALQLTRKDLVEALLGLSPQKQHAAALAIETLRAAIKITDA